jgi:hypothetical protein
MRLHAIHSVDSVDSKRKNTEMTDGSVTLLSLKRQGFGDYSSAPHLV